jgi:uroporphyrinogen decarboxylase
VNDWGFEPDFENLRNTLFWKKNYRVPNMELVIDREIKEAYLGREVSTLEDEVNFRYRAGYDYIWISKGTIDPAGTVNKEFVSSDSARHFQGKDERTWAEEHSGIIKDRKDIENFPWPDVKNLDFSDFEKARRLLPEGMKVIGVCGKIFVATWMLLGFERFAVLSYENPLLVNELMHRIGEIQVAVCRRMIELEIVGGVWIPDDVAYHSGTVMSPVWLNENLFPYYRKMGKLAREADKFLIYHSDGNISAILDLIAESGFNALHPIEPESMDILQVRKKAGRRLSLIGNICVHTLATGTREQVHNLVKERIETLGSETGYALGSSNSVPNYVPVDNYREMLKTNAEYTTKQGRFHG